MKFDNKLLFQYDKLFLEINRFYTLIELKAFVHAINSEPLTKIACYYDFVFPAMLPTT